MSLMGKLYDGWEALKSKFKPVKLQEALGGGFFAGDIDVGGNAPDSEFRSLNQHPRDMNPMKYEVAVRTSQYFYEKNPLFKRVVDIPLQAVTSAGIQINSENERVREVLEDFWQKPVGGFETTFMGTDGLLKEMCLGGELNLPVAGNPINGEIDIAFIDSLNIQDVLKVPGNVLKEAKIRLKGKPGEEGKTLDIMQNVGGMMVGEVFRFTANKPINAKRGKPVHLTLLDWVDPLDRAMFNELDRWTELKKFLWHFKLSGADEKTVKEKQKELQNKGSIKEGSIQVTNENAEINAVTPDLKAADGTEMSKLMQRWIIGGGGLTDFFMGFGGDVNVATAREMQKVVVWMLEHLQRQIKQILTAIFTYQLQVAAEARKVTMDGVLTEADLSDGFEIVCNQVLKREFVAEASSFQQITNSIILAQNGKLIDKSTARKQYVQAAKEVGFEELDVNEIEEALKSEEPERDMFGSEQVQTNRNQPGFTNNEMMRM